MADGDSGKVTDVKPGIPDARGEIDFTVVYEKLRKESADAIQDRLSKCDSAAVKGAAGVTPFVVPFSSQYLGLFGDNCTRDESRTWSATAPSLGSAKVVNNSFQRV